MEDMTCCCHFSRGVWMVGRTYVLTRLCYKSDFTSTALFIATRIVFVTNQIKSHLSSRERNNHGFSIINVQIPSAVYCFMLTQLIMFVLPVSNLLTIHSLQAFTLYILISKLSCLALFLMGDCSKHCKFTCCLYILPSPWLLLAFSLYIQLTLHFSTLLVSSPDMCSISLEYLTDCFDRTTVQQKQGLGYQIASWNLFFNAVN